MINFWVVIALFLYHTFSRLEREPLNANEPRETDNNNDLGGLRSTGAIELSMIINTSNASELVVCADVSENVTHPSASNTVANAAENAPKSLTNGNFCVKNNVLENTYHYQSPRIALALTEVDDWEIHPINVNVGRVIGQGFWGKVHRSLVTSSAIRSRKIRNIIAPYRIDQRIYAAVKILKGQSISLCEKHVLGM